MLKLLIEDVTSYHAELFMFYDVQMPIPRPLLLINNDIYNNIKKLWNSINSNYKQHLKPLMIYVLPMYWEMIFSNVFKWRNYNLRIKQSSIGQQSI